MHNDRGESGGRHRMVGRVDLWPMKRAFQISFLRRVGLQPLHSMLDIGCGTLRGGIPLIEYLGPGRYVGLDIRPEVLAEARAELELHGLEAKEPTLVCCTTLTDFTAHQAFDYIWAFSTLMHMTTDVLDDCLALVQRSLSRTGRFYANVHVGDHDDGGWQGFPVVWRSVVFYEDMARSHHLSVTDLGAIGDLGHESGIAEQDSQRMLLFTHE